jgi:methylaspartate mutase epsilon subunit
LSSPAISFGEFVRLASAAGTLVVQPRMGFPSPRQMKEGLVATKQAAGTTVGTITVDSYTRMGDDEAARRAIADGVDLNGYPIVAHGGGVTHAMLDGVQDASFPVQVRHGSACPQQIFAALGASGLHATEGGPVSYCLPYSRLPVRASAENWKACCRLLTGHAVSGVDPHLETFGGCMLGQLCPPSLLISVSLLEGMFFQQQGLRSISLSYAQQTSPDQDAEAVGALRRLAAEYLPQADWHVVIYAYMGLYPQTEQGAMALQRLAAALSVRTGSERLIVKTAAEAFRIPTIAENVKALESSAQAAAQAHGAATETPAAADTGILAEARAIVEAVLELDQDVARALVRALQLGYLDVPYCLHPDNAGNTRSYVDGDGWLRWSRTGRMPISGDEHERRRRMRASDLLDDLGYVRRKFDAPP